MYLPWKNCSYHCSYQCFTLIFYVKKLPSHHKTILCINISFTHTHTHNNILILTFEHSASWVLD